jgi:hypothetical protein
VIEAGERHVVAAPAEPTLAVDDELGDDEERDALRAGDQLPALAGNLRQHEVDDVLRQLVLAARDPHLVAG